MIHRIELTGLAPGTTYRFRFGEDSKVYKFRTMPENIEDKPLKFGAGGDTMHHQEFFEATNRQVMKYDLDFIMIGGDMAYADARPPERQFLRGDPETGGRLDEYPRLVEGDNLWYHWFDAYKNTLITEEGRVIPMLVSLGNHEVSGVYYGRNDRRPDDWPEYEQTDEIRELIARYFYALFAFPGQPGYNVLDFGDYMSVLLLDTDHTNPVEGEQTEWLERVLSERQDVSHIFPLYHVPAYPSNRPFDGRTIVDVRNLWVPLFEEYGVRVIRIPSKQSIPETV